jgi:hypothetical protein
MTRLSGPLLTAAFVLLAGVALTGCGGEDADDPNAPFALSFSETYLTIRNQAPSAITEGTIELVPAGVLGPFRARLPRIETGANRDVPYDMFAGTGGARFRRGTTRIRVVRVTATDVVGTKHQREVPFE